jgi:hypothetical protein
MFKHPSRIPVRSDAPLSFPIILGPHTPHRVKRARADSIGKAYEYMNIGGLFTSDAEGFSC